MEISARSSLSERNAAIYVYIGLVLSGFMLPLDSGGKLALSNVAQIVLLIMGAQLVQISSAEYLVAIFLEISFFVSGIYAYIEYGVLPRVAVDLFFFVSVLCYFQAKNIIERYSGEQLNRAFRFAILTLIPAYLLAGMHNLSPNGIGLIVYFADDKSQAALYLGIFPFLSLLVFRRLGYVLAIIFLLFGMATISQLPYVFAPFLVVAIIAKAVRESKSSRSLLWLGVSMLIILSIAGYFMREYATLFKSLDRITNFLSSDHVSDSAAAHENLIRFGLRFKLENIGNFIFGASPGDFVPALLHSGIDYSRLEKFDPSLIYEGFLYKAPIHSTHVALYSEFPIWVFVMYVLWQFTVLAKLVRARSWEGVMYFISFNIAVMYYSAHNKFYYTFDMAVLSSYMASRKIFDSGNSTRPSIIRHAASSE